MTRKALAAFVTLAVVLLSTNVAQPISAATKAASVPTATPTATAAPATTVYCLVVAADFNGDGEAKLKEYFEAYKTSHEKYLGEAIVYEWHYYPKDKIPKSIQQSVIVDYNIDGIYKACVALYGQKYWQRVLVSYEMEGGDIAPQSFGYDYGMEQYVLLQGFYEKQLGIHGECHSLEESVKYANSAMDKSDTANWRLKPSDKLKKFWLESGGCHYVVQKDVDRYAKQFGHAPIKWNDPKTIAAQVDYKRDGKLVNVEGEGSMGEFYTKNPKGIYWYSIVGVISQELHNSRQHELEVMQRLQQEFGITLASITPLHPKAKVPQPTGSTLAAAKPVIKKEH